MLSTEDLLLQYPGGTQWQFFEKLQTFEKCDHYMYYTNYFDVPLAHLLAVLVDRADEGLDSKARNAAVVSGGVQSDSCQGQDTGYLYLRSDIFAALDFNYDTEVNNAQPLFIGWWWWC
jgi:hypothetical protein